MNRFLKVEGRRIIDEKGGPVHLKGINLGGWLMMEAYILGAANRPEKMFRREFTRCLGVGAMAEFDAAFRENFIREDDVRKIAGWGFNCIRVPFHYRVVEDAPFSYRSVGLRFLDQAIDWARKRKIWIILDLHAAPGSQNKDWHADSDGTVLFWKNKSYQERVYALWEFLADRYKDEGTIAGYDLLNESVTDHTRLLNHFYRTLIRRIRKIDRRHILFVEANNWATDLDCLEEFDDDNHALSIHSYDPPALTFNFVPNRRYPCFKGPGTCDMSTLRRHMSRYARISKKRQLPVYLGEFGINYRQGFFGEHGWLRDMLACCEEYQFHWTYWTYKTVKSGIFPDGVLSYYENPAWVNRAGPASGLEAYASCWPSLRKEMIRSWRTEAFQVNAHTLKVLRHAAR